MSDSEDKEDEAWFFARERGQTTPSMDSTKFARYAELEGLIADLGAPLEGWEQRMLAALEAATPDGPNHGAPAAVAAPHDAPLARHRGWVLPAAAGVAAALVAVVLLLREGPTPEGPQLVVIVEPTGSNRSAKPGVGDTLIIRATGLTSGELRIYDETGAEQARCAAVSPGCNVEHAHGEAKLVLTFTVTTASTLRAVLFSAPLGTAPSSMDVDVAAAARANIEATMRDPIRFR